MVGSYVRSHIWQNIEVLDGYHEKKGLVMEGAIFWAGVKGASNERGKEVIPR